MTRRKKQHSPEPIGRERTVLTNVKQPRIWVSILIVGGIVLAVPLFRVASHWRAEMIAPAQLASAEAAMQQGRPEAAISNLVWLRRHLPDNRKAAVLLGSCYLATKQFEPAIQVLSTVPPSSSYFRRASAGLLRCYLNTARMQSAEELMEQYLQRFADDEGVLAELYWLYFNQLRTDELEQFLGERIARGVSPHVWLYHRMRYRKNPPIAQELMSLLNRINTDAPGQPSIVLALARCHWKLGETAAAQREFDRALQMRPNHAETLLTACEFFLESSQPEAAERVLARFDTPESISTPPACQPRVHWLRSQLAFGRQQYSHALQEIERALELRPSRLEYIQHKSMLLRATGEVQQAADLRQMLRRMVDSEEALREIVASGEIDHVTPELCRVIAAHCRVLKETTEAEAWEKLAAQHRTVSHAPAQAGTKN